ncbi:ferritin-like domain-containing protein [Schleiferilactobacillus perolens]|jgi:DNA-binding ferritin-like protein|uniref:ferritin-like domain-containing protein n=1 Tax=Schleiferilactobacillus perolens TaxID=100468 RepID=UPI0023569849|nr:ferritin-like domain-containing protein [Schleiferilactobacillus perolens]MCI2171840.1 DNA-binding protein [Schleiferilactobacillus perolens]
MTFTKTDPQTIEAAYAIEQKQVDHDHHVPTAGAMSGHIIANNVVLSTKLQQMVWTITGPTMIADRAQLTTMQQDLHTQRDQLISALLDLGENIPTTTVEFSQYTMLHEDPRNKYASADEMLADVVTDLDTSMMFITRAIALADQEKKAPLSQLLTRLLGWYQHTLRNLQERLDRPLTAGRPLLEEDEDDD